MNIRNTIIEHYKKFFDLHAKGMALTEDDHLNIDWAESLVKDFFMPDVIKAIEEIKNACEANAAPMDLRYALENTEMVSISTDLLIRLFYEIGGNDVDTGDRQLTALGVIKCPNCGSKIIEENKLNELIEHWKMLIKGIPKTHEQVVVFEKCIDDLEMWSKVYCH